MMHQKTWSLFKEREKDDDRRVFSYPFAQCPQGSLNIFVYGSLLVPSELRKITLEKPTKKVLLGFRRCFNRVVDVSDSKKYAEHTGFWTMLNVEPKRTSVFTCHVPGLSVNISKSNLRKLCMREDRYDLVPGFCVSHRKFSRGEPCRQLQKVYVLSTRNKSLKGDAPILGPYIEPILEHTDPEEFLTTTWFMGTRLQQKRKSQKARAS